MVFLNNKMYFFLTCLLVAVFSLTAQIQTDYSWIINIIDWHQYEKIFYNSGLNKYGTWGTIFVLIQSSSASIFGNLYISYWLFNLVYSLFGVLILYKLLKKYFQSNNGACIGVLTYVLLAFFSSIFIGTRPENIYVTTIVILLFSLHNFCLVNNYKWIYISSLVATFGALAHPNGMILFVILFIFALKLITVNKIKYLHLFINILIVLSMFLYGIVFGQTYEQLIGIFTSVSSDAGHSMSFYYEPKRYISFILAHKLISVLFLFGLFTLFIYIKKYLLYFKEYFFENFVAISSLFIIIYLTFIGTKWEYYLSLLFPFMIISIIEYIKDKNFNQKVFVGMAFMLMLITIGRDFKKNEEFLDLLHIPSQRVNIVNEVKNIIKDSTVYAPMRLYVMHKHYDKFTPLERLDIKNKNFDFLILDFDKTKQQYEEKLQKQLQYVRSFVYNGHYYNLFKVNGAK